MLYINPFALLHKATALDGFAALMNRRLVEVPPSPEAPWRIVLYTDEVTPGNQLLMDNLRKMWVADWSFLELGPAALADENAWFCIVATRSCDVTKLAAGISQVVGHLIKVFFGLHIHDFSTGGVVLRLPSGESCRMFAKLGMILQDGGAHKLVWHCKGDAGTKLCMLCLNLYTSKSGIVDEDGEDILTCSLVHENELHFACDDDVRGAVRRLARFKLTDSPGEFTVRQKAIGFKHEPRGLLMDPELDRSVHPVSQFCHDWMHAMFVHGVFGTTAFLMLEAISSTCNRNIWETLCGYVALWTWPCRVKDSSGLKDVFSAKRAASSRKAKFFKTTASEGLSVYMVIAYFVQTVILPTRRNTAECKAFVALADVIDLLVMTPLGRVQPVQLQDTIRLFLNFCLDAGWKTYMHPKFHWLVHLPKHLAQFGCLPTCWVHERKHRMVKRYANEICNTSVFERSVLGEVTSHHLAELSKPDCFPTVGLVRPRAAPARLHAFLSAEFEIQCGQFLYSHEARFSKHESCSKGDVVLYRNEHGAVAAGQIWFHVVVAGVTVSALAVWHRVGWNADTGAAERLVQSSPEFVYLHDILSTVVHCLCRPGICRVIVPCVLRADM